jgi:hypothetical protein
MLQQWQCTDLEEILDVSHHVHGEFEENALVVVALSLRTRSVQ